MRTLGFSMFLATSLVVAPACSKKEEAPAADKKADAKTDDAKTADAPAGAADKAKAPAGDPTVAVAPTAPAGGFPAALRLIPDQAQFVIGLSPTLITASPLYAIASKELESDPDFQSVLSTFKDCGVDPTKFESILVGASMTEDFAAVMVGEGIGEDATASCVIKGIQKMAGDAQAADVVTQDGKKIIQFTDGRAYLVDSRTLAIATTNWQATVTGLIDNKGTAVNSGAKKDLFAKVNGTAAVWGVAELPSDLAGLAMMLGAPPGFSSVTGATGSVDLSDGVAMQALAVFSAADTATAVATQLETLYAEAKKEAPPEMANVVNSVKIESKGTELTVAMTATMDDITKAQAASGGMEGF